MVAGCSGMGRRSPELWEGLPLAADKQRQTRDRRVCGAGQWRARAHESRSEARSPFQAEKGRITRTGDFL